MLLGTLAHNLLIWARGFLSRSSPQVASHLRHYGMKQMIRDLYHISGMLSFDQQGRLCRIALEPSSSLAQLMRGALHHLLTTSHIAVILDQT